MQQPIPQPPPPHEPRRSSSASVFLAGMLLLSGAMLLLALPTGFIGPVIVFGGLLFFGVIAFHYFVWGRWLSEIVRQEAAEESETGGTDAVGPQVPREAD